MSISTRIATALAALAVLALGLASVAGAATGTTAPHGATASCSPGLITVNTAMQTTQSVMGQPPTATGQKVAYQATLSRWDGSRWVRLQVGEWLYGYGAPGTVVKSFHTAISNNPQATTFRVTQSGYYSVGMNYYWYATSDVGVGQDLALAQHVDMGGPNPNGWCKY
jgi:hypothetical protein